MANKTKWLTHEELKRKLFRKAGVKREYDKLKPEFEVASQMIEARLKRKMSQEELAKKAGTGQAVISRLEGMNASPSLSLLKRIAEALEIKMSLTIQ